MNYLETGAAIYFYGQRDAAYGFLSNFEPCVFKDAQERTYYSSEQYFMKRKQELFDPTNEKLSKAILSAKSPPVAKKLGRQVQNYNDKVWGKARFEAMKDGLFLKFTSSQELKDKLLATGEKQLYEAAPRDKIWGIGRGVQTVADMLQRDPEFQRTGDASEKARKSYGTNLLGLALMETRSKIRALELQAVQEQEKEQLKEKEEAMAKEVSPRPTKSPRIHAGQETALESPPQVELIRK